MVAASPRSDCSRTIPFELEHGAHVGGINHFDLLNHPAVYEHLGHWLARGDITSP